jgi:cytochrome P450
VLADGGLVPKDTAVGVVVAVVNRDESLFEENAGVWNPERWLAGDERINRMNQSVFTWGWGSRRYTGKHDALLICCKLVLQIIQQHFSIII